MTNGLFSEPSILERRWLEHRPFGQWPSGEKIRDVSGVVIRANVDHLEEAAGTRVVEELCHLLNERIVDSAYHVTPRFLRNIWHSYSYEFAAFLGEFCGILSGDPHFQATMASEKFLHPLIQTLGRPFSVAQIYGMFPYFGEKFAKGSLHFEVVLVTEGRAVLRMRLADHVVQQFGPYRNASARLICEASKAGLAAVPKQVHQMEPATIRDCACIARGDDWCEWEFRWHPGVHERSLGRIAGPALGLVTGGVALGYLHVRHPEMNVAETMGLSLFPAAAAWLGIAASRLMLAAGRRERILEEQIQAQEQKHEGLREAYLELEQNSVELNRAFEGFVQASVTAIESRDPITSGHSNRVALLTCGLAEVVDRLGEGPYRSVTFTTEQMKELRYASLLHDFGKVGVREHILVKAEKLLPEELTALRARFELIKKSLETDMLQEKLAVMSTHDGMGREELLDHIDAVFRRKVVETDELLGFLLLCNRPTVLPSGNFSRLQEIAAMTFDAGDGPRAYLTRAEADALSIPKGSLTPADRLEIESHAAATYEFLCAIPWSKDLRHVPEIAYGHHEKLDGAGYPRGIAAAEISLPTRMMTISDIYDALTAGDRPYKKSVARTDALDILYQEGRAGKVDLELLHVFVEGKVYERIGR